MITPALPDWGLLVLRGAANNNNQRAALSDSTKSTIVATETPVDDYKEEHLSVDGGAEIINVPAGSNDLGFFGLPSEIRENIYSFVLVSGQDLEITVSASKRVQRGIIPPHFQRCIPGL
jgi:hypothetical protein